MTSIHIWTPDFRHSLGGIQTFSRLLEQALHSSSNSSKVETFSFPAPPTALNKMRFSRDCLWAALTQRPDLVIVTQLGLARIAPLLIPLGIPYWICAHGIECWHSMRKDEISALSTADRILVVSQYTRERLIRQIPGIAGRCLIFPNHLESPPGKTIPAIEARKLLGLPVDARIFLTVSRLRNDRYKGHREIMQSLCALGSRLEHVHYVIVGDGDDLPFLKQTANIMGLGHRCHFLGALPNESLPLAYDACDAFVMPSTGEGFGIVFLEALSRGKPVLAGSTDGSIDALNGGRWGILVNPRDPAAVASGLVALDRHIHSGLAAVEAPGIRTEVLHTFGPQRLQEKVGLLLQDFNKRHKRCAV